MSHVSPAGLFAHDSTAPPASNRVLPLFSLAGKTAIVSGATAGIGYAVAQGFAEAGANVAIWYNSKKEQAEAAAAEIEKDFGVKCKAYQVNVASFPAVSSAVNDHVLPEFNSRLDIFVANSGIAWEDGPMLDGAAEDRIRRYKQIVDTNLDGTFFCARVAGEIFRRQKQEGLEGFTYGSFIATASMSGSIVNIPQLQTAYNASKAGVIHLVKSLAVEWVGFARANTVSPGYIVTEISKFCDEGTKRAWRDKIPMGREGMPNELKGAYLYLASDAASYTTGIDLVVDGGYCAP
ncbi:putative sorbose reductase SOU1 [Cercophora samala]|uniref:Sorbose reductase SOU1 n=1 Tax=Cercophora samala TaxID=330535 RepID=A0AA39ZMQ6_9PEZI|nr:putative sorbose reductase SOU1 [Cercophora samala]